MQAGIIQPLDARVKVIFTLVLILCLSLTPVGAWPAYILFQAVTISLALLSGTRLVMLFKRSLLALPFALAALPLIFSGPQPHLTLLLTPQLPIGISPAGAERMLSIALKSWISVQAAILLTATTSFPRLLAALQQLKLPPILLTIIGLMWRYLFIIQDEVTSMLHARASRSTGVPTAGRRPGGSMLWRARVTGNMAGSLFLRSLERSDRVYAAMLSRGYNGELPPGGRLQMPARQVMGLVLAILFLLFLLFLGILTKG